MLIVNYFVSGDGLSYVAYSTMVTFGVGVFSYYLLDSCLIGRGVVYEGSCSFKMFLSLILEIYDFDGS